MTLDNFDEHIPKNILARGQEYQENGQVIALKEKSNSTHLLYEAAVKGTQRYTVQVQVDKSTHEIVVHRCTCPFEGDICKHVAAVLIEIGDAQGEGFDERVSRSKKGTPDQLLDMVSAAELKQYLRSLMEENRDVKKHFLATFITKAASDRNDYKAIITQSLQELRGAISFERPNKVYQALVPIHKLLEQAENTLNDDHHEQVFSITQAVLEKLVPSLSYIDDSNGWMSDCIQRAVHLQYLLTELTEDKSFRKEMFNWFLKSATNKQFTGWDCAWDFANLAAITATPALEEKIVAMTTAMIRSDGDSWSKDFDAGRAAEVMLIFYQNHKSEKDVEAFIGENLDLPNIREKAIKKFIHHQNFERAIALCKEGIEISQRKKLPGEINGWYEMLLGIYQQQKNKSGIIECAEYLWRHSYLELAYYKMLRKELSEAQWKEREPDFLKLYQQQHKWSELATIYAEEDRKPELMCTLRKARHLPLIKEFQKRLLPEFASELKQLYFGLISEMLEQYPDRSHYREVARTLKAMKKNFEVTHIQLFVTELKEKYKIRPALLDELKSV